MEINDILKIAIQAGASDIHLKAGMPPIFRIDGTLLPLKDAPRLPPEEVSRLAFSIMNDYQRQKFQQENDIDFAYGVPGLGRFRVNVFSQRGAVGMVMRVIPFKILPFESLNLPKVLEKIAMNERGLILVTGTTGSGKSTTLASMIDYINTNRTCHIVTIEDPIEFLIRDKRSIINQREIGTDTMSFAVAMRAVLRQDPDVIMVGEMRDLETMETALTAGDRTPCSVNPSHTRCNRIHKQDCRFIPATSAETDKDTARLCSEGSNISEACTQGRWTREGTGRRDYDKYCIHKGVDRGQGSNEGDSGGHCKEPYLLGYADL